MARTIITPKTGAELSASFYVAANECPIKFSASGLAGAEVITLYAETVDGAFTALTDSAAILTATAFASSITAAGSYKLNKPVTAGAAGVSLG